MDPGEPKCARYEGYTRGLGRERIPNCKKERLTQLERRYNLLGGSTRVADDTDPPGKGAPSFDNRNDVPIIIYFDIAPAYGVMSGIVQIELGARVLVPHQDDSVDVRFVTVGRLRCSATAATHLRNALDASLKMLEQPVPNPVGASKLN